MVAQAPVTWISNASSTPAAPCSWPPLSYTDPLLFCFTEIAFERVLTDIHQSPPPQEKNQVLTNVPSPGIQKEGEKRKRGREIGKKGTKDNSFKGKGKKRSKNFPFKREREEKVKKSSRSKQSEPWAAHPHQNHRFRFII